MNKYEFDNLAKSTRDAMKEVHQLSKKIGHNDWMDTIESQLEFIEKHAINEKNPVKMLSPDQEFTYGIISSRQLASPDEMRLKEKLNQVTNNLRDLWD
ncbi:MAG: DNA-binding ferritin-like protein (Dps family) [Thalassolituus sp.]|jgi:DNA-binding ferritin-like protein (Dps family)